MTEPELALDHLENMLALLAHAFVTGELAEPLGRLVAELIDIGVIANENGRLVEVEGWRTNLIGVSLHDPYVDALIDDNSAGLGSRFQQVRVHCDTYAIWWTSARDVRRLAARGGLSRLMDEMPAYVRELYELRARLGDCDTRVLLPDVFALSRLVWPSPHPDPVGRLITVQRYVGIGIWPFNVNDVLGAPGFVTDLALNVYK